MLVKSPTGSQYIPNLTADLEVLRNLDLIQIEIVRCQKGKKTDTML